MTKTNLLLLAATCVATLSACGDSDSATAPGGGASVPFATAAVGTWTANKQVSLKVPFLGDSLTLTPTVEIRNDLESDGEFTGHMFLRDILDGNGVDSALYKASGTWIVEGDSILILRPQVCLQAEMKSTAFGTLPFSAPPELKANALGNVPCGAPDTLRAKPVGTTWTVPLDVNLPAPIGSGTWLLTFTR